MIVGDYVESVKFELGGFVWILVVKLLRIDSDGLRVFKIMCVSCSGDSVHAGFQIKAGYGTSSTRYVTARIPCTACPFGWIYQADIPLRNDHLLSCMRVPLLTDNLVVEIDMKDIRKAAVHDPKGKGSDITNLTTLEVTGRNYIERYLNDNVYGVGPQRSTPNIDVYKDSLLRYWGTRLLKDRYWECQRENAIFKVKECLSDVDPVKTFSGMRTDGQDLIVFKEERSENEEFKPTSPAARLFHFKLIEYGFDGPSYIGHLIVRDTDSLQDMLRMAADMARIGDERCDAYVEVDGTCEYITQMEGSVGECDYLQRSSVITLSLWPCHAI